MVLSIEMMAASRHSSLVTRLSIARIRVRLEVQPDVGDAVAVAGAVGLEGAVDEAVEAFVGVGEEGAAGDDQDPVGVPDAAADQAGVGAEFVFGEVPGVVVGAEGAVAAALGGGAGEGVEVGQEGAGGGVGPADVDGEREDLVEDGPGAEGGAGAVGAADDGVGAGGDEVDVGGVGEAGADGIAFTSFSMTDRPAPGTGRHTTAPAAIGKGNAVPDGVLAHGCFSGSLQRARRMVPARSG